MLFQLDIQLNHIINPMLNKIRKNNIRLAAGRPSVTCPGKQIPGFIHIQSGPDTEAESRQLLRMIVRVIFDLGKDLFILDGPLVDFRILHPFLTDQIEQIFRETVAHMLHTIGQPTLHLLDGRIFIDRRLSSGLTAWMIYLDNAKPSVITAFPVSHLPI